MMMIKSFNYVQGQWEDVTEENILTAKGEISNKMMELSNGTWVKVVGDGTFYDEHGCAYGTVYWMDITTEDVIKFLGYVKL